MGNTQTFPERMMDNDSCATNKVETTRCLARWSVYNFSSMDVTSRKSEPFKIGMWNWHLSVVSSHIKLCPELPTVASFIVRMLSSDGNSKLLALSVIKDRLLRTSEDHVLMIGAQLPNNFIIEIEFLDLKMTCPKQRSNETSNECLGRMLTEGINTDITIYGNGNIFNESIRVHRAVLAARSPVFRVMFSHNFKENDLSIINISDMSFEACRALINYLYGTIKDDEFLTHRLALLHAADKYDISDLREACHESLLEDIDRTNVLERLQYASLYKLPKLKSSCIQYLVKFGKIFDIRDDFNAFLQTADRDLISEVFHEILNKLKGL